MSVDLGTVQSVGEVGAVLLIGGYTAWKARKAERQTRNTGNGFAGDVKASLARIERKVERVERKVDNHLQSHADAQLNGRR